jgi:glycosyltransferase involved in cell wall biosynthesis
MREAGAVIEVVPYNGKRRYRYYREVGRIIREYSISLVHICFFDYYSLVPWLIRFNGLHCILYEELNSGMMKATSWRKKLLQLRTKFATWPMTRVIAVSEFVKQDLVKRGISAELIDVRYLAADEKRFSPNPSARHQWDAEYSLAPDELMMSTVTLLRPFKSPETLVEMCAVLRRKGVLARLFVAGDGAMLGDLKRLTKDLDVDDRIHWLGFCRDPVSLLQASDIFLLASVGEAGGFVLSEAMGCGTPIVGSRSGVIPECVEEGKTGLLATPMDPESFADAVERLAKDRALLQEMSDHSRARMLERFTVDMNVQKTLHIYNSLLLG